MNAETYTIDEAAVVLGISRGSAYAAAASGEIPTIRIGRRILIPKASIDAMMRQAVIEPTTPAILRVQRRREPRPPQINVTSKVSVDLNNRLVEAATARGVSLSAEVAERLARSFDHEGKSE